MPPTDENASPAETSPSAPPSSSPAVAPVLGADDGGSSALLADVGEGESVIAGETTPAAPARPRRSFREWLLRSGELASKKAQIAGDAPRVHAIRRGRAALVHASQAAHPVGGPREGGSAAVSLGLAVEGLVWALAAQRADTSVVVTADAAAALAEADPELIRALCENETDLEVLRRCAAETFVDRAARPEADVARDAEIVRRVGNELLHRATAPRREIDAIRVVRLARIGVLLGFLGLICFGGYKGVVAATLPPDIAKGRPWTTSSTYPNFSPQEHTCDGTETYVIFHTREEENPWFQIDLGSVQNIKRIDVRNRMDGLRERAVPLIAEVSEDGRTWREVAKRTTVFDTWTAKFAPTKARYVRLKALRRTFLHLENVAVR